jgi:hypothetical protein
VSDLQFQQLVSSLKEQVNSTLSRSDILKPLAWYIGIFTTIISISLFAPNRPGWLLPIMVVFLGAGVSLYMFAYLFCLIKKPDALRSEKYSLHKMAIESGLYGDSLRGMIDVTPTASAITNLNDTAEKTS